MRSVFGSNILSTFLASLQPQRKDQRIPPTVVVALSIEQVYYTTRKKCPQDVTPPALVYAGGGFFKIHCFRKGKWGQR